MTAVFLRIKAPRKMGKTSLMSRILHHAKKQGDRTAFLNLWSQENLIDPNTFLQAFFISLSFSFGR